MSNIDRSPSFSFRGRRDEQDEHAVPVPVLVQIPENAQRAFEFVGIKVSP